MNHFFKKNLGFQNHPEHHGLRSQAGVSLLMAILVLASITAISFSIANVVLIEIRSSSDFVRSERALYAAYSITEEALFKYSRNADFEYLNGEKEYNGVTLEAEPKQVSDSPIIDTVETNSANQYDLVDSSSPSGPGGYSKIEVIYRTIGESAPLQYTLWMIDPASAEEPVLVSQGTLDGYGSTFEDENLDTNMQYQLIIQNENATDVNVAIYTYGPTDLVAKGLPNFGQTFVDITASYLGLTRRYEARIPVQ